MRQREKYVYRLLVSFGLALMGSFAFWWFRAAHIPDNFGGLFQLLDILLFVIVSYVIWHPLMMEMLTWVIARKIHTPPNLEPDPDKKVAFITTFVPGAEPLEMLHRILPALVAADYPHDSWLLDEGDNDDAKAICAQYGVKYFSRKPFAKYNTDGGKFAARTKGGNHNAWYDYIGHTYDFVAQIDTDFIPRRDFLTKTLGYFRDPTVAFVGTPQVYGNTEESVVAKGAAQQTYGFYGPILRGLFGNQMTLMIGANHVVRVKALRHIGYYEAHLTEDLLTGLSLHEKWYKSVYVPEVLAIGEGPATWPAYFTQQMRWAHGCMDVLLRHTPRKLWYLRRNQAIKYFWLQQHYFSGVAMMSGVLLLMLYFLAGINSASIALMPALPLYGAAVAWTVLFQRWLQRFYVRPDVEGGIHWAGMFVSIAAWPIYFLAFIGALRGKRLHFKVTPKGERLPQRTPIALFWPHITIASMLLLGLLAGILSGRTAGVMVFWAINTIVLMFAVAFYEWLHALYHSVIKRTRTSNLQLLENRD